MFQSINFLKTEKKGQPYHCYLGGTISLQHIQEKCAVAKNKEALLLIRDIIGPKNLKKQSINLSLSSTTVKGDGGLMSITQQITNHRELVTQLLDLPLDFTKGVPLGCQ